MLEPKLQKIALFGGTFDPVHEGHLEVAANAVKALSLDRVIFLPCRQSPHKSVAAGASEQQRLEMLRLTTQALPWAEVSDWEYEQPIPSYSWRTAEAFLEQFPEAELYWLLGGDQWEVLPTWNRFDYLVKLVRFIVHARQGEGRVEGAGHESSEVTFVSGDHAASSTIIREAMLKGQEIPAGWLSKPVFDYLRAQDIYQ